MEQSDLGIRLQAGPDVDDEELANLTAQLQNELLDLDVDDIVPQTASGDAPADSKGVALGAIGGLLVQFALSPEGLGTVVSVVRSWLSRQRGSTVELTLGDDTIKVSGRDSDKQERLVDLWIARHGVQG